MFGPMNVSNIKPEHSDYPLFLKLAGQPVLIIGGNEVAVRKSRRLIAAGAHIEMVFETACDAIRTMIFEGRAKSVGRHLPDHWTERYALVLIADPDLLSDGRLAELHRQATASGTVLNVVDRPDYCTATIPAVVDRNPVVIAIGTGGRAPELARMIRSRLEALLPHHLGMLARLADRLKDPLRRRFPDLPRRRQFLHWLLNGAPADAIERGDRAAAETLARQTLERGQLELTGSVALVGAGPGDPELLTVRALRLVQEADVIVHDGLVDARVLEYARRDADLIDVTKRRGFCRASQDEIQALLVEHARKGARVVRLKGGDPMVFGRGGEELQYLRAHGIDYQVVPGITAAVACGAYAGIPLTHRDHAQSVRLITAHCQASIDRLDWQDLACDRQTLAFYMAVAQLEVIQQQLLSNGRAPDTPIALVENGTRPDQRVVTATLDQLVTIARSHDIQSPAMLYIGEVAALAETLSWYGQNAASCKPADLQIPAARAG